MVKNSFLGVAYQWWISSKAFALLSAIWKFIDNAYENSVFAKFLRNNSKIQQWYEASLLSRIIDGIFDFILKLLAAICSFFKNAADSSLLVRLCRGSFIINYEFLLGAFICIMFIVPHEMWGNSYALAAILGFFVIYLALAALGKRKMMYPHELGFPFMLFVISCLISLLFTYDRADSFRILLIFFSSFLFMYTIAADITDEKRLEKLMAFIFAAVIITSAYAVIQRMFNLVEVSASFTDLKANPGVPGRVISTLDNPNNFAEFLVLFTPLCAVFAATRKNNFWVLILSLSLALPAVALIMTYSRSGWVSLFLAIFIYAWLRNKKLIPILIVLCLMAVPFLPDSVITRLSTMTGVKDSSAAHRIALWQGVLDIIRDHGITGIGMGPDTFAHIYPNYAHPGAKAGAYHTQMLYLELIVELGILGLVSCIWMAVKIIRDAIVSRHNASRYAALTLIACVSALLGITFSCCFEYIWFYPRDMFAYFILLGITLAAMKIPKEQTLSE